MNYFVCLCAYIYRLKKYIYIIMRKKYGSDTGEIRCINKSINTFFTLFYLVKGY